MTIVFGGVLQKEHFFSWQNQQLKLNVVLQPNAKKDEIVGVFDGYLKIKIKALPIEGKANEYAIKFLATWLDVPKSDVKLIKGHQSKRKLFSIYCPEDKTSIFDGCNRIHF